MCKAIDLSKYIIGLIPVDNLKLQKLLYYCQGIHLARVDKPIFNDRIEAWTYGPVVPTVYRKYKEYGLDIITLKDIKHNNIKFKNKELETIDMVLAYYGSFSGLELVSRTHSEPPWINAFEKNKNNEITKEAMKEYFKSNIKFTDSEK